MIALMEARTNSAPFKRAEQLKRWEESDTNRESIVPKQNYRKVKFSSGCVFLAACAAGDKDEVVSLLEKGADINTANVDGLTALHQACIDDNFDMVEFLVEHGADVNRGDNEGWTPLHATASCGLLYIAKYLIENGAHVAAVSNDGELAVDIAECQKMVDLLHDEIKNRGIDCESARNEEHRIMMEDACEWLRTNSYLVDMPHSNNGAAPLHVAASKGYIEVMKILLKCNADVDKQDYDGWTPLHAAAHWGQKEACRLLAENLTDMEAINYAGQSAFELADPDICGYLEELKSQQQKKAKKRPDNQDRNETQMMPHKLVKMELGSNHEDNDKKQNDTVEKKNLVNSMTSVCNTELNSPTDSIRLPPSGAVKTIANDNTMINEDTINNSNLPPWRKVSGRPPIKSASNDVISPPLASLPPPSPPPGQKPVFSSPSNVPSNTINERNVENKTSIIDDEVVVLRKPNNPINIKETNTDDKEDNQNLASPSSNKTSQTSSVQPLLRRSFAPPVRDEESETQRKAHAKRVRETRRSTQGVTLEEIKSAEQLVKKKNQANNNNSNCDEQLSTATNGDTTNGVSVTATIHTATPTVVTCDSETESSSSSVVHERRPSWRLKIDSSNKFKLEDATKPEQQQPPATLSYLRRSSHTGGTGAAPTSVTVRPTSAPIETADTTVTLPLRRPKSHDERNTDSLSGQDKENDIRNAQMLPSTIATQAAIQRRKRPKRRSTGVVSFDNVDDLDQDKDPSTSTENDETPGINHNESGSERSSRSRFDSSTDLKQSDVDYKKLYEEATEENSRLKEKLRKSDEELRETKHTLEKINVVTSKNPVSELEKRERRAMERKLSEMEEELKQLQKLKAENERLKADNRSLTRVITKLTNSPKK